MMGERIDDILSVESSQDLDAEKMDLLKASVNDLLSKDDGHGRKAGERCERCSNAILIQYSDEPVFCFCQAHNNQQKLSGWCRDYKQSRRQPKIMKRIRYVSDVYRH